MCGIVGYVGKNNVTEVLIKGLKSLEYRGYDSSGIAVHTGAHLVVRKKAGRLSKLEETLRESEILGHCGIGHTRWATHGAATDENAHPFVSEYTRFAVVHNGIITNYRAIKNLLLKRGVMLRSDTDSEVIAHLLDLYYTGDTLSTICQSVKMLEGSFALGILAVYEPNTLYGVRKDSPLIVGKGDGENWICSDISALSEECGSVAFPKDDVIVRLTDHSVNAYDTMRRETYLPFCPHTVSLETNEPRRVDSYMLAEIREVPDSLVRTLEEYPEGRLAELLREASEEICVLGCGSAYHAGLTFSTAMREIAGVRVHEYIASEFLTERYVENENALFIAISQSGETADTLQAVKRAKRHGARVLAVCNVATSSLIRLADECILTRCGTEKAVAATKSYSAQVAALFRLCLQYADIYEKMNKTKLAKYLAELNDLPRKARQALTKEDEAKKLAQTIKDAHALYCLGKGADYYAAKEGSLKIKEVSYLFSEAYPSGELKHGTLALMERGVCALFLATDPALAEKSASSIAEVSCRGASAFAITTENLQDSFGKSTALLLPDTIPVFSPVVSSVALQLIAYYVGTLRGCDVDRPRNLAKSVTVE